MKRSLLFLLTLVACSHLPRVAPQTSQERSRYEASGSRFAIATQGKAASQAAERVFKAGGNLMDAAIAASLVISVERPQSTGIGGGGFMLFRNGKSGDITAIDFRERAPVRAHAKLFLDQKGEVIPDRSTDTIFAVAVPGLVAGLEAAHQQYGKIAWKDLFAEAIALAEQGVDVYPHLAKALVAQKEQLAKDPAAAKIFLKADGTPYGVGEKLVQKDLAQTLRQIADKGASAFYKGPAARALLKTSQRMGGLLSQADLSGYKVKWRKPVCGSYHDLRVCSMPPPSSGGVHILQILNMLENDKLAELGAQSAEALHLQAAAMQRAFVDRATYMGDPDFVKVPTAKLIEKKYAQALRAQFPADRARKADELKSGTPPLAESTETTNFSMIDSEGNMIVSTQTVNGYFGAGIVAEGAGFLLNNEMDDFAAKPGAQNQDGAVGGNPNAIAPRKTPLSSMSPTLVLRGETPVMALGAPGGTRILTCVAQTIMNYVDFKAPLYDSIATVRFHHQWKPDEISMDPPGVASGQIDRLRKMGYTVQLKAVPCSVNAVAREGESLRSVADPRDLGSALAF